MCTSLKTNHCIGDNIIVDKRGLRPRQRSRMMLKGKDEEISNTLFYCQVVVAYPLETCLGIDEEVDS